MVVLGQNPRSERGNASGRLWAVLKQDRGADSASGFGNSGGPSEGYHGIDDSGGKPDLGWSQLVLTKVFISVTSWRIDAFLAGLKHSDLLTHDDGIHTHRLMRVILLRFYPPPFPDEKRFDLLAFSAVSHLEPLPPTCILSSYRKVDICKVERLSVSKKAVAETKHDSQTRGRYSALDKSGIEHNDGRRRECQEIIGQETTRFIFLCTWWLRVSIVAARQGEGVHREEEVDLHYVVCSCTTDIRALITVVLPIVSTSPYILLGSHIGDPPFLHKARRGRPSYGPALLSWPEEWVLNRLLFG